MEAGPVKPGSLVPLMAIAFGHARWRATPWRDITRIEDGKASLLLHRANKKPLVIGYDWFDGTPEEIKSAIERQWRTACAPPSSSP